MVKANRLSGRSGNTQAQDLRLDDPLHFAGSLNLGTFASSNPEPRQANDRRTEFVLNGPSATAHAEPRRFLLSYLVFFSSPAKGQI